MSPVVTSDFGRIVVMFGEVPHLCFDRERFIGFQSWKEYDGQRYTIEWTLEGGTITTEYDDAAKWRSILQQVAAIFSRSPPPSSPSDPTAEG